ncbi:imidazole glycerol phosphate synthase subunit HisH [Oscillatoria sp. FACHB-1407]|uniref:imidazole glycerol phosphate synthase subunit HisH n=1 Tax=Oscillatoria sp. FACHB-1407 TaxID=2692847 RepID=UPI001687267F|nr:imidazole glycerol phosphate synthase subunit HisH [Oscillatoria sp. FACHB-1407]MBD2464241.1 imidazole glycerol phosphate synthase subunit HisH [Oscillatoria sp. FACHB-1407]
MTEKQPLVGIINYGMGNLRSVANAIASLQFPVQIVDHPTELIQFSHIILPGVGAFGDAMNNLQTQGWISALEKEVRENKKPFLGICLGMQLLATMGTEHGTHKGLDWVAGTVERLPANDPDIRIPHIGWNDAQILKSDGLYAGFTKTPTFYFVHSYVLKPSDRSMVSATTTHGTEFVASIEFDNIYATQFHPEKSQKVGLALLKNFLSGI